MAKAWPTTQSVDHAVAARDVEALANLIRQGDELTPEVREYLANVVADLFNGRRKFPRRRPKKRVPLAEDRKIQVAVWEAIKAQGTPLRIKVTNGKSRLQRGDHSVKVAVATVATALKCSETTVWKAWEDFDPLSYEYGKEKREYDAMMDSYHEFRAEEALRELQHEFGNKAEFTAEEIEAKAEELDEDKAAAYRYWDP